MLPDRDVHEEIIDVETFVALDNTDFCRLELTTGQRKKILKYQSQLLKKFNCVPVKENSQQEEDFVEEASEDTAECEIVGDSIPLENEFDIDLVFRQSAEGLRIMELLRQENEVDGKLIKAITTVLCDYLVRRFGYHPSMHYKDVIAKSLVRKYSTLKSRSAAIPQALWFYPHGRGQGKHSGKLHYHIEYMVKKFNRQKNQPKRTEGTAENSEDERPTADENINISAMIEKLKYIVPNDESLNVIKGDWVQTFSARKAIRDTGNNASVTDELLEAFPLMTAYNGSLISMDFELMFPDAGFNETWEALQEKILDGHINLHSYIKSKFVRALVIIKEKNPSRGAKRTIDGSRKITNLLERIIEWINPEDDVEQFATSYSKTKLPVLVMKAQQYEEGPAYVLLDKRIIPAGCDVSGAFLTLVQTYFIFKLKFEPAFANFFNFFVGAVLKIENLATTVDNFLFSLN